MPPQLRNHKSASPNTAVKTQLDKISSSDNQTLFQTEVQRVDSFAKTQENLNFTEEKLQPRKMLKSSRTLKFSDMKIADKGSSTLLDEKKKKKRRNKTYDR